jgi:hypothetical protein
MLTLQLLCTCTLSLSLRQSRGSLFQGRCLLLLCFSSTSFSPLLSAAYASGFGFIDHGRSDTGLHLRSRDPRSLRTLDLGGSNGKANPMRFSHACGLRTFSLYLPCS